MRSPQLLASGTAAINMTPMIDVVFLLIIFFLVSSHLAKQENSIPLELPEARSGLDGEQERESVVVNILPNGTRKVAGVAVDDQALELLLLERAQSAQIPLRLKIRTDKKVPYRQLEPVLRAANDAGIGDIVFSVYEDR